jgi:hypothetical protein
LKPQWKKEKPIFQTQKEYMLYKIYLYLEYDDGLDYLKKDEDLRILENKYIRTIARAGELNIDNKSVY